MAEPGPGRAQRWPVRPRASPLWTRRGAQWTGRRGASRASLSDSLHLFEVNERSEWCELCNAPRPRAPQVARSAAEGRGNWGSPSFAYFSWAIARKVCRPRGRNPAPLIKHRASGKKPCSCGVLGCCGNGSGCSCGGLGRSCGGQHRSRGEVPGLRPAAQSLSLASPRESNQREGDPGPHVPPLRSGQPAVLGPWVHCTTRTVRCAHSPQTGAMSQLTKREMLRAHPWPCAPRRGHRGGSGCADARAIAALGLGFGPSLRSAHALAIAIAVAVAVAVVRTAPHATASCAVRQP